MSESVEEKERAAAVESLGGVLRGGLVEFLREDAVGDGVNARVEVDAHTAQRVALGGARKQLGEGLLRGAFALWENPQVRPKLLGILQAALNGEEGAAQMREYLAHKIFEEAGNAIGIAGMDIYKAAEILKVPTININAAVGQVWGVVLLRYVAKLEPIASASVDELIDLLSPAIQGYLS